MSISDVAFRWGFNDAGHFSRAFKDQFGVTPREYRQDNPQPDHETEPHHVNRGWPQEAIAHKRQRAAVFPDADPDRSASRLDTLFDKASKHHHLPANENTVHWGYFSRALPPVLQISSGDKVTVEAVTQHGNDDRERMIDGDEGMSGFIVGPRLPKISIVGEQARLMRPFMAAVQAKDLASTS